MAAQPARWGISCDYEGDYCPYAQLIDTIIRNRAIPITWAAGNERGGEGRCGNYHTICPTSTGKNAIVVGAMNSNDDSMTTFSSWGPTDDGRIKPDVVAAGCENNGPDSCEDIYTDPSKAIWSTVPDNLFTDTCPWWGDGIDDYQYPYSRMCGTSMATPAVSGSVGLMLEDWRDTHTGDPLPSTMKAILIQTAEDLGNAGPDYSHGYGLIDVKEAIDLINSDTANNDVILEESILEQDDKDYFTIDVPQGLSELIITLVWDDYPGDPAAAQALVNDLDLIVTASDETRHFPWTLDPANPGNPAVRNQEDHLNNIEQVHVDNPVSGVWTVEIEGTTVPEFDQTYSLVTNNLALVHVPYEPSKFYIKSASGETVAWFSGFGNLVLKGTLEEGQGSPPGRTYADGFRFRNAIGVAAAIIDGTNGNMYIKGSRKTVWEDPSGASDDFIIKNSSDEVVAYISESGDLYLKGELYENTNP